MNSFRIACRGMSQMNGFAVEREAPGLVLDPVDLAQSEHAGVERERCIDVAHAQHGVEVSHRSVSPERQRS